MSEFIHIATAGDSSYLVPLKVMIASLAERLRPSLRPVLYLLNRSLTEAEVAGVHGLIETRSVVPGDEVIGRLPTNAAFPSEAAFPLVLADVLPKSVERVLFLDPDLLVLDDVGIIWETDLCEAVLAAARDQAIPTVSSPRGLKDWAALGVPGDTPYFNAGVMLIDLARWRSQSVTPQVCSCLEGLSEHADFYHQQALNAVLQDQWLQLEQRWNLVASLAGRVYGPDNAAQVDHPGIVHFAGKFKPWRVKVGGPFAAAYRNELTRRGWDSHTPTPFDKVLGLYDRHLRDHLYGIEHLLWKNRLI